MVSVVFQTALVDGTFVLAWQVVDQVDGKRQVVYVQGVNWSNRVVEFLLSVHMPFVARLSVLMHGVGDSRRTGDFNICFAAGVGPGMLSMVGVGRLGGGEDSSGPGDLSPPLDRSWGRS